jgi:hypothetical protein
LKPHDVIKRKKVILPGGENRLLRCHFADVKETVLESDLKKRPIFDFEYIRKALDKFERSGKGNHESLWNFLILFLWRRYWIEGKGIYPLAFGGIKGV